VNGDGFTDFMNLGSSGSTVKNNQLTLGGSTLSNVNQQNQYSLSTVSTDPAQVTNGDFNADGYQDIATFDVTSNSIMIQMGGVVIQTSPQFLTLAPANLKQITSGDVDGDGYQDLLTLSSSSGAGQGQVAIYRGSASGLNSQAAVKQVIIDPNASAIQSAACDAIHAADLDGDSIDEVFLDISGLSVYSPSPGDRLYSNFGSIWNYRNGQFNLSRSFNQQSEVNLGPYNFAGKNVRISSGDFDGDGNEDILSSFLVKTSTEYLYSDQVFYGSMLSNFGQRSKLIRSAAYSCPPLLTLLKPAPQLVMLMLMVLMIFCSINSSLLLLAIFT
jgi:hypothetical protein